MQEACVLRVCVYSSADPATQRRATKAIAPERPEQTLSIKSISMKYNYLDLEDINTGCFFRVPLSRVFRDGKRMQKCKYC